MSSTTLAPRDAARILADTFWMELRRPILERLKQIDGRAPVSIMTVSVEPHDPQLQAWLKTRKRTR